MLSFGTSGLRGLVEDMTDREYHVNVRGFLEALIRAGSIRTGNTVSLAGDLRASTERILKAVVRAVLDAGCRVDYCGHIPSPALACQGFRHRRASIMVTGSHIPDDRNGIKFNKPDGEVLKSDEAGILAAVAEFRSRDASGDERFDAAGFFRPGQQPDLPPVNPEAEEAYVRRYLDVFPADFLQGRKIVLEQHSAVGRDLAARVLQALGADLVLEGRTDYFVAKDTENVTAETRENFVRLARKHAPFAIVSTDGDSDRPFVVDENGVFNPGDALGAIAAQFLGVQAAVVPISANDAVVIFLQQKHIFMMQTRIGSPYVIAAMNQAVADGKMPVVGWEANGGFLTATELTLFGKSLYPLPTRDALLPILCALGAGVRHGSLSAAFGQLPKRYTQAGLLDNFPVGVSRALMDGLKPAGAQITQVEFKPGHALCRLADGHTLEMSETAPALGWEKFWQKPGDIWAVKNLLENRYFTKALGFGDIATINVIDGIRIGFSQGDVVHIRPSGNAPQLRIYSNASSQKRADEIVQQGLDDNGILRKLEADIGAAG
ncbi:MAG: phosphomannomutase [Candidatus Firestonebacteria bacterium]|nr:phosphomannomutase [Candidatus Firestonebacteria bacterium]